MFTWRSALILGVIFIVVGAIYFVVQDVATIDRAGVVMLLALGAAMAFGFSVLLRGSREL